MYVITDAQHVIIYLSETVGYQVNGNVLVDNGTLAIASALVGGVSGDVEVPDGVGVQTHCYEDGAFSENPGYEPPEPTEEDDINAMLVDHEYRLTMLELGL